MVNLVQFLFTNVQVISVKLQSTYFWSCIHIVLSQGKSLQICKILLRSCPSRQSQIRNNTEENAKFPITSVDLMCFPLVLCFNTETESVGDTDNYSWQCQVVLYFHSITGKRHLHGPVYLSLRLLPLICQIGLFWWSASGQFFSTESPLCGGLIEWNTFITILKYSSRSFIKIYDIKLDK